MTGQAHDNVMYQREYYSLVGIKGTGLFDPAAQGIEAQSLHTGCRRGFICDYAVKEDTLRLHKLTLGLDVKKSLPLLWGHPPQKEIGKYYRKKFVFFGRKVIYSAETGAYCYSELDTPVEYTGGLLIRRDFIETLYIHGGFQKAYRFEKVCELTFDRGFLTDARDVSDAMAAYRREMHRRRDEQGEPTEEEKQQWLEEAYTLAYSRWLKIGGKTYFCTRP